MCQSVQSIYPAASRWRRRVSRMRFQRPLCAHRPKREATVDDEPFRSGGFRQAIPVQREVSCQRRRYPWRDGAPTHILGSARWQRSSQAPPEIRHGRAGGSG
jgi:hypothetical protein